MRRLVVAILALHATGASAQVLHLGEVERWLLALRPMHEAVACFPDGDPLRPGLEAMLRDTHQQAMHAIRGEYEKGVLAGRLAEHRPADTTPDDGACPRILAAMARGLVRLQLYR
jgi:hypothetical protein